MLEKYSAEIIEKAKKIKLLVLDVDGVLTDGRLIYGNYGDELKSFNVNDGLGVYLLKKAKIRTVILTAKASKIVVKRAKELKVSKVYQGYHYKKIALDKIKRKFRMPEENMCFIGDDVIDIPVLKRVGLAVAPANGMEEVKEYCHLVTENKGGEGAVREVCNLILKAQGKWNEVLNVYFE